MRVLLGVTLAVLASAGGVRAQVEAPVPVDPAGSYSFETVVDGQPMTGTFEIVKVGDAYAGSVSSDHMGEMTITAVSVDGQRLILDVLTEDGTVQLYLTFAGNNFSGYWQLGDQSGDLTGRRIT